MPRSILSAQTNRQRQFGENLTGTTLGVALYSPLTYVVPTDPQMPVFGGPSAVPQTQSRVSGKVGDVAFFTKEGKYQWLANAFDHEVADR